ncbi:MAG: flagellar hook protein [Hydrogenophilales bacterium 16-64-46]|nr:MAG: flagellar hook protein [Hydrogenophilales bacterium 12-64-13]OYZ04114.1 MAG: flagellar hook protein [Hydrogenophilales bacterium 16-64-46]OZA36863.1 MAG: flagellar hook protein [Hydrogenophilales bacterium 17-64-34]HQT00023.1 flagellar filament capping protein FliD [Thiobacillus sp.]
MASISSSTQTAIDVPSLVAQLMVVERQPVETLNTKISATEASISSWGSLSSLLSTFQTATQTLASSLEKLAASSSDTSAYTAVADSSAIPGSYSVSVSQLAQAQNLVTAGQASGTAAIGDGAPTTLTFDLGTISGGTLTDGVYSGASFVSNGDGTASIVIDSSNNTLEGIRDAINAAGIGVVATIVNDGSGTPYRLTLSSAETGASSSIKISVSGGDGSIDALLGYDPAGTQNLTQTLAAQNAELTVNGIPIVSASNTVSEPIQGVTLTLKNVTTTAATLTIDRDIDAINTAVESFVEAYNALNAQIKSSSIYGTEDTTAGALSGDSTLRSLQEQLRNVFNTATSGGVLTQLAEIGISFQKDGSLAYDSTQLEAAIATNFDDVLNLLTSSTGFLTRLDDWADSTLDIDGLISQRTQNLKDKVSDYNDQIDLLEIRLEAIETRYTREYTNLNLLLGRLNTTSTFLSQQLLAQPSSE